MLTLPLVATKERAQRMAAKEREQRPTTRHASHEAKLVLDMPTLDGPSSGKLLAPGRSQDREEEEGVEESDESKEDESAEGKESDEGKDVEESDEGRGVESDEGKESAMKA